MHARSSIPEISFNLAVKLSSWAALTYNLAVTRIPLVLNKWQVTNSVMLSITLGLVKSKRG